MDPLARLNLNARQRGFVISFTGVAAGNATKAARIAKYANPALQGHRLLRNDKILKAIRILAEKDEAKKIGDRKERRELFTKIMRGEEADVYVVKGLGLVDGRSKNQTRLRAAELLGKMSGDFLDRVQIEGAANNPARVWVENGRGPKGK